MGVSVIDLYQRSHEDAAKKSFVLTLPEEQYDLVFSEYLWPRGIRVRDYEEKQSVKYQ